MNPRNLGDQLQQQARRLGPRPALRHKRNGLYWIVTWREYADVVLACAARLIDAGIQPGDRVGLWSANRLEWLYTDMAILTAGAINVPAHATLSPRQVMNQFAHAEVSFLFLASVDEYQRLQPMLADLPKLRGIVIYDGAGEAQTLTWSGFVSEGSRLRHSHAWELDRRLGMITGDDLATIMYTSGTTGNPKGVMLTHHNLLSNALSMMEGCGLTEESIVLTWLPFSHIYARTVDHYIHLASACTLCLAVSQDTVVQNLDEIQPTSMSAVPRFYEKVLAAVRSPDAGETLRRLRKVFGPRIEWLNSGGAPLPLHVAQTYVDAGLVMLQGYGLTESSPVITFNRLKENRLGTVGQAVPGVEVRIASDGEVLTRGPHVMKGYWKDPQATADTIRDGCLHTGDLGSLDEDGYLSITGRKKELLVLSNGKKVIPPEVESQILTEPCIDQVVLYGEGKNYLSALIVPNFERLRALAAENGIQDGDNHSLVNRPDVMTLVAQRLRGALRDAASWEQVHKFILLPRPFSQEADELTVSLKLRRGVIFSRYREQLEALYRLESPRST